MDSNLYNQGDLESLLAYLTAEKTRTADRMRNTATFLKNPWIKSNVTMRESCEILRNNAEADYDLILHCIALLQAKKDKNDIENNSASITPPSVKINSPNSVAATAAANNNKNKRNSYRSAKDDEYDMVDPLTEDFYRVGIPPSDDEDGGEPRNEDDEEDDKVTGRNNRKNDDEDFANDNICNNLAKSLPVSVPWPKKPLNKNRLPDILDDESCDLDPESIHRNIQTMARSLHSEAYDFGDLPKTRFSFQAE